MTHPGWIAAGLVLGPALQLQLPWLWPPVACAALLGAGLLVGLAAWRRGGRAAGPGLALAAALAGFALAGWRAHAFAAGALPPALEGRDVRLEGRVAALPQAGANGPRFLFEVQQADRPGVPRRVMVSVFQPPGQPPDPRTMLVPFVGERWRMTVRLRAPHGNVNPHGFDLELWAWEQGLQAGGTLRPQPPPEALPGALPPGLWLERLRQSVRDRLLAAVADPRAAGVLAALAVGDQQAVDRRGWDLFRATGVAHLMSISGLHVTGFAWLAAAVIGRLWRRSARLCLACPAPHAATVGGLALAIAYAAFAGWGVPAQRTVWMLAAAGLLRLSGRRWPWPQAWLAVAALVVTIDPWALAQPGFWLSFVAVGLLFATDAGRAAAGWRGHVGGLLRQQGVMTVGLAPLTLLLFGQVSVVGLLANLVAIPWVTMVVTPLALAGALWPPLWQAGAWAVAPLVGLLQALAGLPLAVWSTAVPPPWMAAAALAGGALLVMRLPPALRLQGLPLLLPALLWQPPRPAEGQFELLAADIGQGNAVLVRTARHSLLYDTGPRLGPDTDAGSLVLVPLLRALGERPDRVVVSHRDSDHSGGAAAVLAAFPEARLMTSVEPGHALDMQHLPERCMAGQRWRWDGVDFEVLHPPEQAYREPAARPNALSCVLRVGAGGRAALLAGDIERPQELRLVGRLDAAQLRADLLLVPHHGSKTSSSEPFLDTVAPRIAVVQAGWRNRYGHPAAPVMARYEARGIRVVDSPSCGAARWSSQDPGVVVCERTVARRYWHHRVPPAVAQPEIEVDAEDGGPDIAKLPP